MQIINNQETLLVTVLKECITQDSNISIATDYYTFNSLFLLLDELALVESLRIVIDNSEFADDIRFVYDTNEISSALLLTSIYKLNSISEVLKDKAEIKLAKTTGLKSIIVDDKVFLLTPHSLTEPTMGTIKDSQGYSIIQIEDIGEQNLSLFNQAWDN